MTWPVLYDVTRRVETTVEVGFDEQGLDIDHGHPYQLQTSRVCPKKIRVLEYSKVFGLSPFIRLFTLGSTRPAILEVKLDVE